jgi:hypothetical protein
MLLRTRRCTMHHLVPYSAGKFLRGSTTGGLSKWAQLLGDGYTIFSSTHINTDYFPNLFPIYLISDFFVICELLQSFPLSGKYEPLRSPLVVLSLRPCLWTFPHFIFCCCYHFVGPIKLQGRDFVSCRMPLQSLMKYIIPGTHPWFQSNFWWEQFHKTYLLYPIASDWIPLNLISDLSALNEDCIETFLYLCKYSLRISWQLSSTINKLLQCHCITVCNNMALRYRNSRKIIWGFQGDDYDEFRLMGCYAVCLL